MPVFMSMPVSATVSLLLLGQIDTLVVYYVVTFKK